MKKKIIFKDYYKYQIIEGKWYEIFVVCNKGEEDKFNSKIVMIILTNNFHNNQLKN